jgi:hypothetical protein
MLGFAALSANLRCPSTGTHSPSPVGANRAAYGLPVAVHGSESPSEAKVGLG